MSRPWFVHTLAALVLTARCGDAQTNPSTDWPDIARRDLAAARHAILAAHPAALAGDDPAFNDWIDRGFGESLERARHAVDAPLAAGVLRHYLTGFQDGHVGATFAGGLSAPPRWAGWTVRYNGHDVIVSHPAPAWPAPIPPRGARVVSCDGVSVKRLLRQSFAPYVDRRLHLPGAWHAVAQRLTVDLHDLPSPPVAACRVRNADGTSTTYPLHWKDIEALPGASSGASTARRPDVVSLGQGRYWVTLDNFNPEAGDNARLERVREELQTLRAARLVVLDTRGNRGGSSLIGSGMLAALGVVSPPSATTPRAYWRVSGLAMDVLQAHADRFHAVDGPEAPRTRWVSAMLERLAAARVRQENWVEQPTWPAGDPEPATAGKPFSGRLVLVTDMTCASACLDFADEVLAHPGARHWGQTTSADTNYLDVGSLALPSGATLWLPMKVWRGRTRGHNVPLVPHATFTGDIDDTPALQAWVFARRGAASRGLPASPLINTVVHRPR